MTSPLVSWFSYFAILFLHVSKQGKKDKGQDKDEDRIKTVHGQARK